jgi:hypothetical protein
MTYEVPNQADSMNLQRRSLPQIDVGQLLKDKDFKITDKTVRTKDLIPTQKHFNDEKVLKMIDSGKNFDGVVTSSDGYVLDGHHRWLANHATTGKINVHEINGKAADILEKLDGKDYVESRKLMESKTLDQFIEIAAQHINKRK